MGWGAGDLVRQTVLETRGREGQGRGTGCRGSAWAARRHATLIVPSHAPTSRCLSYLASWVVHWGPLVSAGGAEICWEYALPFIIQARITYQRSGGSSPMLRQRAGVGQEHRCKCVSDVAPWHGSEHKKG